MEITRRKFVLAAPLAAGTLLALDNIGFGQKSRTPVKDLSGPLARNSFTSFNTYISTDFLFTADGGTELPLTLTEVKDQMPAPDGTKSKIAECFQMTFTGPMAPELEQGTYHVKHFALGEFDLFITEGALTKRGKNYVAIVNHIAA